MGNGPAKGTSVSKSDLLLLFWAYRRFLMARIRRFIYCEAAIEDIFQEACLKLLGPQRPYSSVLRQERCISAKSSIR